MTTFPMQLIVQLFNIMINAWNTLSTITVAGFTFTSIIISYIAIVIVVSVFWGGKTRG